MQPSSTTLCPSCNRYIGPVGKCPYCNTDAGPPPLMRAMRLVALLLATAGLLLLYLTARHREPPLVRIADITPVMNFAQVRVAGTVSRKAYISRNRDSISFTVADDSGSIRVAAYRHVASALLESNQTPGAGDHVEVSGSLSVTADAMPKLYLKAPAHLSIEPRSKNTTP